MFFWVDLTPGKLFRLLPVLKGRRNQGELWYSVPLALSWDPPQETHAIKQIHTWQWLLCYLVCLQVPHVWLMSGTSIWQRENAFSVRTAFSPKLILPLWSSVTPPRWGWKISEGSFHLKTVYTSDCIFHHILITGWVWLNGLKSIY